MTTHTRSPSSGPARLALGVLVVLFGAALGLGLFTFGYAEGLSYFSSDPAACVNCHAMRGQFDGWNHSSHKAVAACNDCHTPHRFPDKWIVKGINGFNHSLAFTTGNYPDPIHIRAFNAAIAHENCVACHTDVISQINHAAVVETPVLLTLIDPPTAELSCVRSHGNVGHDSAARN